ncbi:MAG: M48 family metalloprotease [Pseudomonadota bacterium]
MRFFEQQREARRRTQVLVFLFFLTVLALVLAINASLALTWRLIAGRLPFPDGFFAVNTAVTLLFVLGGWWIETSSLKGGGEKLARRAGAREARPQQHDAERRLCNIADELAIAAGFRSPQVMVLDRMESINAFAAGWSAHDSVIAVTQGALERLNRDELQGLLAHEFGHISEGDTRLNMRLAGMVSGLEMLFVLGQRMCEKDEQGRRSALALPGAAILLAGSLGWLAGRALKAAVSRQREYLADARAVQFTRSRDGLGGVLRKIAGEDAARMARQLPSAMQHMLLVSQAGQAHWLDSHPPLVERIRRIYGRPMAALPVNAETFEATRPQAIS